jgi:hypothetical protein
MVANLKDRFMKTSKLKIMILKNRPFRSSKNDASSARILEDCLAAAESFYSEHLKPRRCAGVNADRSSTSPQVEIMNQSRRHFIRTTLPNPSR